MTESCYKEQSQGKKNYIFLLIWERDKHTHVTMGGGGGGGEAAFNTYGICIKHTVSGELQAQVK